MISVGSAQAPRGSKAKGFIKVGELALQGEVLIPVVIVNGKAEGPTLWLNGGVHGDELNGFLAIRNVAEELDPQALKGALVCTPLCNPLAVQWRHKIGPFDFLDLDQQFPGDPAGQISQQIAYHLFREIKGKASHLINFHTAGTYYMAPPYTVFKKAAGVKPEVLGQIERLAKAFGLRINCRVDLSSASGELPGNIAGALDVSCALQGIPAFMAEVGSGGKFEKENIAVAELGIRNVMKHLGMIPGEAEPAREPVLITRRRFLYSRQAGFLLMEVEPGTILLPGKTIGRILDLFSEREVISAPQETWIIQVRTNPVVHAGDRIAFLGLEWEPFVV